MLKPLSWGKQLRAGEILPLQPEEAANGRDRLQGVIKRKKQLETKTEVKKLFCLITFMLENKKNYQSPIMALVRNSTDLHCILFPIQLFIFVDQF